MKKKATDKSKYNLPLRRQSFSDFSQSYSGGLNKNKLSYNEKMRRRKNWLRLLIILGFIAIFIAGYLTISVIINLSNIPPETTAAIIVPGTLF